MSKAQTFDVGQCEGKDKYDEEFLKIKKEKLGASGNENGADISKSKMKLTSGPQQLSSQANEEMIKNTGESSEMCSFPSDEKLGWIVCP